MRNGYLASVALGAAVFTLVACGPSRPTEDAGVDAGDICGPFGCPIGGSDGGADGGADGGTGDGGTGDGGTGTDGGTDGGGVFNVTIEDLRGSNVNFGSRVRLTDVVVTAVSFSLAGTGTPPDYRAEFWVGDPASPTRGIWVRKFYTDTPGPYLPAVGDKLTIEGWFGTERRFLDRHGYRRVVKNEFDFGGGSGKLVLTQTGTVAPLADNVVQAGTFGNAQGGTVGANPEYAGSRVHVQGPVELIDPSPGAFKRISANPNDSVYFGFEIEGGILVNNYKTFTSDGGCPWRDVARDAGTQGGKVVFAGGVRGVWDTFTHAPCADGGTASNCLRNDGHVPGTDAGHTFVLYPQSCDDFVGGEVQSQ